MVMPRPPTPYVARRLASPAVILLLIVIVQGGTLSAQEQARNVCAPDEQPVPVALDELWEEAGDREPGYAAAAWDVTGEEEFAGAVRRERLPWFSVEGLGNHGQRLSPGEERVLGVGARGELRLLGTWPLLDSNRRRLGEVAGAQEGGALAAERRFDVQFRSAVALAYAEAAAMEELEDTRRVHAEALRALADPVRVRLAEGVDVAWEAHLLEEGVARAERLLAEAVRDRDVRRGELSLLVDRCVRPQALLPTFESALSGEDPQGNPEVRELVAQALAGEARARQEADRDRWSVQLLGGLGPNYSRAFDGGNVRNEYLVGFGLSWRPDLTGVRRGMAAAEESRARATRFRAESLRRGLEREMDAIRIRLGEARDLRIALSAEREQAERTEEVALLRWREGVGRWTEVMDAADRVMEVRVALVELALDTARTLVREAEIVGDLERLPRLLTAGGER
jgi:outer membrane protein TolC